jgi:aryl-alcohol dehydrogenase-like predicted oxidoreductase
MEHARIPGTSLDVSRVALGTWAIGGWMWGGGTDETESVATLRATVEHGVDLIDTAPAYGFGRSEEIVGKALAGSLRSRVRIATKVGLEWQNGRVFRNASRARILKEVDDSLRRLQTDHIDIYQVHWPDPLVSMEETAGAMRTLFEQGKIGAIGVSNFSVAQMDLFRRVAPIHVLQPPYNLFERGIDAEVLPYCRKNNIAIFGYGALCRGLLSGRVRTDTKFSGDDLRRADPKFQEPRFGQYLAAVERLDEFSRRRFGKRVIQLAVRWMLDQGVTTALWGARHPGQLGPIDEVSGWSLDAAARAEIDRIVAAAVTDPVGPEFMAPPARSLAAA